MLIGIAGGKRSGKDTIADYIISKHPEFIKYSFAYPLKNIISYLTGWGPEYLDGDLKELVDPEWGFSPRTALQQIGTQGFRRLLREDFWVKVAKRFVNLDKDWILPDVRFEDEAEFVRDNGYLIHTHRIKFSEDTHESEEGVLITEKDFYMDNTGTLEVLYEQVDDFLEYFEGLKRLN